jgi:lipopolysaccharide/colanic/teichoic acid biosynthesis glycosyltransferase
MTSTTGLLFDAGSMKMQPGVSTWNCSRGKRLFDLLLATVCMVPASPVMLAVALVVKLTSQGPIFFRQRRVGKEGREFQLIKFRTMVNKGEVGPRVTRAGDPRITAAGRVLRRWKLDELPQLLNVIRGEMSFVGPRPDIAEYLASLDSEHRKVLELWPGLTGAATLQYRNEEELLSQVPASELQQFYCTQVLPEKVRIDLQYAEKAGLMSDLGVLLQTVTAVLT